VSWPRWAGLKFNSRSFSTAVLPIVLIGGQWESKIMPHITKGKRGMNSKSNIVTSAADGCGKPSSIRPMGKTQSSNMEQNKESFMFSNRSSVSHGCSLAAIGTAVLMTLGFSAAVRASVIQLTTGDPTATAPASSTSVTLSNVVDAIYTPVSNSALNTGAGTLTWQGVVFSATNANVSRAATNPQWFSPTNADTASNAGFTNVSPSTEDTNLLNLVNAGKAYNASNGANNMSVTITGLTPDGSYYINNIVSLIGDSSRPDQVSYNGASAVQADTINSASPNGIYDIYDTVSADSNGTIAIDYTGPSGPFYNAVVVSSVPEPATLGLVAVGGLGLLLIGRKRAPYKNA
jgi:hypothetical protein